MHPVTADYLANIFAVSRRILGRVTFDISPIATSPETVTLTTSEAHPWTVIQQLDDDVRENTYNLATWELDRTKLDGSFTFAGDMSPERGHVAFISDVLSDGTSAFSSSVFVIIGYDTLRSSPGVTVTFDPLTGEHATSFRIRVYDDVANTLKYQQLFSGNTEVQVQWLQTLTDFTRIAIDVYEWSGPHRRARIAEVDPGVLLTYDNDKLARFTSTEETDITSSTMVIPEFEFTIDNSDMAFDPNVPDGLQAFVQLRQKIQPELGLELDGRIEWVPLGEFLLTEWKTDRGSMTATFRGRNRLDVLDDVDYESLTPRTLTLKTLIEDILTQAGVASYAIDSTLAAISTKGITSKRKGREALLMAAMAGCANVYVTRDGVLHVTATRSASVSSTLTFDELLEEPEIEWLRQTKTVTVPYYTNGTTLAGDVSIDATDVQIGDVVTLENTFIETDTRAGLVASWLLSRRNERKRLKASYRGQPALELMDLVSVQTRYTPTFGVHLTKLEMDYQGYLTARMEGRTG